MALTETTGEAGERKLDGTLVETSTATLEMVALPPPEEILAPRLMDQPESTIFLKYYTENDFFVSPEGILKVLGAIVCVTSSVLLMSGGRCAGAPWLVTGSAATALACGAGCALLYAAVALGAPLLAPQAWLLTDIIVSTVMGVVLLVSAALGLTVCDKNRPLDYVHGPLGVASACLVTGSAVATHAAAMRRWDAARPAREPARAPPVEQDA